MKAILYLILGTLSSLQITAQSLKPFIGLNTAPNPEDSMCAIVNYLGGFGASGYKVGDTVHDFTLYDKDSNPLSLSTRLKAGKPVLLISSSYTCPVFRGKIPEINQLQAQFGSQLEIYIIYTVEAHPDKDISPYFGRVNTGSSNINSGILYRQPVIYADRLAILNDMLTKVSIDVPVYVDGPCNEWWYHFGPAPNNATLIDPNGIVRVKHAWFDRSPDDIFCDVRKYFDPGASCDSIPSGVGNFTFTMVTDTLVSGFTNSTFYAVGTLQNTTKIPMTIEVRRLQNNMPAGWSSSMCLDVCYPTTTDSTRITLKGNEKMDMIIDFFSGPVPAKGSVRIGMRNVDNTQNRAFMQVTAVTQELTSTDDKNVTETDLLIYPQPSNTYFRILSKEYSQYMLFDEKGIIHQSGHFDETKSIQRNHLPSGMYFLKLNSEDGKVAYRKVIFN